jgi:hypothetical protein
MSAVLEQDIEETDRNAVVFQRSTPDESMEEDRSSLLPHYGCSPFMDISVRDRYVLPADQLEIKKCALVEFVNLPVRSVVGSDENNAPGVSVSGNRARGLTGVEGSANYVQKTKSARACAAETAFAYRHNNAWGFQVFEVLTGRPDVFDIFRSVLPRRMNANEMYEHLLSLDGQFTGPAEAVRRQLITACEEFGGFGRDVLTASAQEVSDRKAGGKGKARYDKRDEKIAAGLGEPLPELSPTPVIQMPVQPAAPTIDLAPLAEIFKVQAEEAAREREENKARLDELAAQVASLKPRARMKTEKQ